MPAFTSTLRAAGATYCLGLHAKMPPIDEQLPILRALWPGPLVCRWNLHRRHGAYGYEAAKTLYGDFNALVDPDPQTRATLARVIAGRSEEHTSELPSLMRLSYAVFCLTKTNRNKQSVTTSQ